LLVLTIGLAWSRRAEAAEPTVLVRGVSDPLAVDDAYVYSRGDSVVDFVPKAGGPVRLTGRYPSNHPATCLAAVGEWIYLAAADDPWEPKQSRTEHGYVLRVRRGSADASAEVVATFQDYPRRAIGAGGVLFVAGSQAIYRIDDVHRRAVKIATLTVDPFNNLVADAKYLYVAGGQEILRFPVAGGRPSVVVSGTIAAGLAVDDSRLYWTVLHEGTLRSVPLAGGKVSVLANGLGDYSEVLADHDSLFITRPAGPGGSHQLLRMNKDGGAVTVLADHLTDPRSLVADSTALFFVQRARTPEPPQAVLDTLCRVAR
jgi:hypothetical protein